MNTTGEPMPNSLPTRRIGLWLSRHRVWGLVPLIIAGLFVRVGSLSVSTGLLMMLAGGVGILAGTLLRIICRTFTVSDKLGLPLEIALITWLKELSIRPARIASTRNIKKPANPRM